MAYEGIIKQPIGDSGCSWEHEYKITLNSSGYFDTVTKLYLVVTVDNTKVEATGYEPNIYFDLTNQYGFGVNWELGTYNFYDDTIFAEADIWGSSVLTEIELNKGRHLIQEYTGVSPYTYTSLKSRHDFSTPLTVKCNWMATDFTSMKINGENYSADEIGSGVTLGTPEGLASSISCATTYIGETANIIIKKNDSSFTTTITYTFGSLTGTIVERYSGTSYRWAVPASFVNELASDETEKVCILTCTTYDSKGNQVGQSSNLQVTLLLDSAVGGPKFTSFTVLNSDTEEAIEYGRLIEELTGDPTVLVKYFSYAYAYAEAQGQSGATVSDIKVMNSGKTADNGVIALGPVESPEFTFVATDSRGFTSSATYLANWVDYSKLSCNAYIDIPTPFGDSSAVIEGNCFKGSFGAVDNELKLEYTLHPQGEAGTWVTVNATPTEWHNYSVDLTFSDIDYKKTYVFQARATDKLMTITTPELIVTGEPIFDWGKEDFHIRVPLSIGNEFIMETDKSIGAVDSDGNTVIALTPRNSDGDTVLGYGNYAGEGGDTYIYGNAIHLVANNGVTINGQNYEPTKVLWQGADLMGENAEITLSDTVDNQQNGILLVFSLYRNNTAEDVSITTAFIGKKEVELLAGAPHFYFMGINAGLSVVGAKYLYIANDKITGHSGNSTTGTAASGIIFNNNNFVLRYVIGV